MRRLKEVDFRRVTLRVQQLEEGFIGRVGVVLFRNGLSEWVERSAT